MTTKERIKNWKIHPSMRGRFGYEFYKIMADNPNVWLVTGDLGYGLFDAHHEDFADRFINAGAAEQAMMDIAVGLSLSGKIPFVYSITPFLIYRPFEVLRTYIDHENLNVKLLGGGRDDDYKHDGFSHDATDVRDILNTLLNIEQYYPDENEELGDILKDMVTYQGPQFLSLRR